MTTIESEQSREVKLAEITRGPFVLRFLSYRKSEDAALNLRSEDYVVSELTPDKAIFGLCDGVGSSFYGNLGSQILGEILLSWLGKLPLPNNLSLEKPQVANSWLNTLTTELTSELNNKVAFATSIIQKKEISSPDELVRLAEITQRDDFGTQSNFACGVVWPKSVSLPKGLVLLFWLGNARIRLFNQNRDLTSMLGWGKNPDQLKEVWSSKDGVVGKVYSYITDLSTVTHLIAYSDGLENAEEQIHPNLDGAQLEGLVQQSQSIKDDDATFLELTTRTDEIAGLADDMVVPLRRQLRPLAPVSHQPAAPTHPLPEAQKSRTTPETPQKKPASPGSERAWLIALATLLATLCFCTGFLIRPVVVGNWLASPTPTSTHTLTPTLTPTLTMTPSATVTFTETATSTFTPTATATLTATETPTATLETVTPSAGPSTSPSPES